LFGAGSEQAIGFPPPPTTKPAMQAGTAAHVSSLKTSDDAATNEKH
jgi:hypothetical protein